MQIEHNSQPRSLLVTHTMIFFFKKKIKTLLTIVVIVVLTRRCGVSGHLEAQLQPPSKTNINAAKGRQKASLDRAANL